MIFFPWPGKSRKRIFSAILRKGRDCVRLSMMIAILPVPGGRAEMMRLPWSGYRRCSWKTSWCMRTRRSFKVHSWNHDLSPWYAAAVFLLHLWLLIGWSFCCISLGDKEEKTRNPVMSAAGCRIREANDLLVKQGISTILEWNQGNHFMNADLRMAKAFAWVITQYRK